MSQTTKNVFLSDEQWNSIVDSADTELEEYEIEGVAISKDSFDSYCELENKYNFVKQILAASPVNNSYLLEVKKSIDEDFYVAVFDCPSCIKKVSEPSAAHSLPGNHHL